MPAHGLPRHPVLERPAAVEAAHAPVAQRRPRLGAVREQLLQAVGGAAHRQHVGLARALVAAQQPSRRPRCASTRARAAPAPAPAASARPRFKPWPASGCTVWAASPASTQPGPHQRSALAPAAAARPPARWPASARPAHGGWPLRSRASKAAAVQRQQARLRAAHGPTRPAPPSSPPPGAAQRQKGQHFAVGEPLARDCAVGFFDSAAARRWRAGG